MTKQERLAGIIIVLVGLASAIYSTTALSIGNLNAPGPGMFPFISGIGMVILTLIWMIPNLKKIVYEGPLWEKGQLTNPVILIVLMAVYIGLMEYAGYIISTMLFLLGWQFIIERQKLVKGVLIAVICTVGMYILFVYLLRVPLPQGILEF